MTSSRPFPERTDAPPASQRKPFVRPSVEQQPQLADVTHERPFSFS